jgi:CubicO group peptidase (beta-lactamase class C family)
MLRFMRSVAVAMALAAGLAAVSVSGQQRPQLVPPPGGTLSVLETYLDALRQQAGIPGMSGLVLRDGSVVWEKGFGFQDVGAHIAATPDTPYLVGDMSQTIASALVLECVEQRRFGLDDPFQQAFGLTAPEATATARQLLSHASSDPAAKNGFLYSPGRYDNLTALMEWCAPQPYRKSVGHRILDRLAMTDSVPGTDLLNPNLQLPDGLFTPDEIAHYRSQLAKLAVPYKLNNGHTDRSDVPLLAMTASNGLVSTVRDLSQLDRALDARLLLLDDTLQAAWTPVVAPGGGPTPMGLGWFVQYYHGERIVWHFGYVPNAYSALWLKIPGRNLTFILLANSDGLSAPFDLAQGDVTRSVFASLFLRIATSTPAG